MNKKMIQEQTQKMLAEFNDNFLMPYVEKNLDKESPYTANLMISFAASAFMRVVVPILLSGENPKKAIDDANGILNDLREQIKVIVKKLSVDGTVN